MSKLTRLGYGKLKAEYEDLFYKQRPKIVKGVTEAAAEGDRSENAEYIYGKKHLREIDKRLSYLGKLLKKPVIINSDQINLSQVSFGCRVKFREESGDIKSYQIVGEGETEFHEKSISEHSPVAKALLGKQIGDIVEIFRPKGKLEVEILEIKI